MPESDDFEELDHRVTPAGELSLRRRRLPWLGATDVFEIKLDDAFLMSSLFHTGEVALAELALAELDAPQLDMVVGGLGLGYTASAALDCAAVREVVVIEALEGVIDWHRRGLVPLGRKLAEDARCRLVQGDFFALAAGAGFDPAAPDRRFHAVLLDIDHSPRDLLRAEHGALYRPDGLRRLRGSLHAGGVFGVWSNDPPDEDFLASLHTAFGTARAHVVAFDNPFQDGAAENTVYLARAAGDAP